MQGWRPWLTLVLLIGLVVPSQAQGPQLSFFNLAVLGDSLAAGFISGGFSASGQQNSFAAQLARHLRTFLFLPLIAEPGIPAELQLLRPGFPPEVAPKPGTSSGRTGPLIIPTNLAVPGASVSDALRTRPSLPIDSATDLVLGVPGLVIPGSAPIASQVEMAEFLRPSTAIVWLGSNDALGAALAGSPNGLTPLQSFETDYRQIVTRLRALGTNLILLNIPDVTAIPAIISVPVAARTLGVPEFFLTFGLGVTASDYLILSHVATYQAILTGQSSARLRDDQVLTAAEALAIRARVNEFNQVIRAVAASSQSIHVDIHRTLNIAAEQGIPVGNRRLTTQLLGGLFSLDGVHPTYTGQAVIANEILSALNQQLGLSLPLINAAIVLASDPLVLASSGAF